MNPLGMVLGLALLAQTERPTLTVALCDQVGIDDVTWLTARTQTIRVFDTAGVDLKWLDADRGLLKSCKLPSIGSYLLVIVAHHAPKGWTTSTAMGFSPASTGRAYIFYDPVKTFIGCFASEDETPAAGILLGHVIAHELGHLLIPTKAHGEGIMRPKWSYPEWKQALEGTLLFNPNHAEVIRDGLRLKQSRVLESGNFQTEVMREP